MQSRTQNLIASFEQLSAGEQSEVAKQILRRTLDVETPEMTDDELINAAEDIFSELDCEEAGESES